LQGYRIEVGEAPPAIYVKSLEPSKSFENWKATREEFDAQNGPSDDFKARSDRAAFLIYTGEPKAAITILEAIEKEKPGEYIVAANLGTAYELAGDDAQARRWIERSIELNPESHYGTEWLHVLILNAKLARKADPGWLQHRSVLGIDFGDADLPANPPPTKDKQRTLDSVRSALEYQLHERLYFAKPPDPIVADLLFDLGNVLALTASLEHAVVVYEKALEYGPERPELVRQRLAAAKAKAGGWFSRTQWLILVFVAFVACLCLLRLRRKARNPP